MCDCRVELNLLLTYLLFKVREAGEMGRQIRVRATATALLAENIPEKT